MKSRSSSAAMGGNYSTAGSGGGGGGGGGGGFSSASAAAAAASSSSSSSSSTHQHSQASQNRARQYAHLHAQLARLNAHLADTENLVRMTAVQAEYIRGLGAWTGGLFMAASKILGEEGGGTAVANNGATENADGDVSTDAEADASG